MLKFFRGIRKKLADEKNLKKYFAYAIGEILLVVIGILIALQINNWNENRINKNIEEKLLIELRENLETNINRLQDEIRNENKSISAINLVVDHIDRRKPYNDSLNTIFRQAFRAYDIVLSSSAYESIKSKGFEIILSDSLRKEIIDLFDVKYTNLISETVRLEDQFWPSAVLPILHTHFRWEGENTIIPVNYEALLNDQTYINMITNRRHFRLQAVNNKSETLSATESLLSRLNQYLDNTRG
jgi:hypothetical protein